jgi:ATP-dependent Clp protease ATP-binding subunit ClpA
MARLIHDKIKQPLANEILFGKLTNGGSVLVDATDDMGLRLNFKRTPTMERV